MSANINMCIRTNARQLNRTITICRKTRGHITYRWEKVTLNYRTWSLTKILLMKFPSTLPAVKNVTVLRITIWKSFLCYTDMFVTSSGLDISGKAKVSRLSKRIHFSVIRQLTMGNLVEFNNLLAVLYSLTPTLKLTTVTKQFALDKG